jgi:hypothetical protein
MLEDFSKRNLIREPVYNAVSSAGNQIGFDRRYIYLAMSMDEEQRVVQRPDGQFYGVHPLIGVLFLAEVMVINVIEEQWAIKELGNQFADIAPIVL